jgi:3-dehydroquinate synthase
MIMAAELSDIDAESRDRLRALISFAGLPVAPPKTGSARLLAAMGMDKKVIAKKLRFVLLRRLGDAFVTSDIDEQSLEQILEAAD